MAEEPSAGTAKEAMHGAAKGAAEAGLQLLKIVFGWILPLITLVIGVFAGGTIGLSGLIALVFDQIMPSSVTASTIALIADLVAIAIWGAIAAGLWSVGTHFDGKWAQYVLRPIATLFGGFALSEIPPIFKSGVNNGYLGGVAASATKTAMTPATH